MGLTKLRRRSSEDFYRIPNSADHYRVLGVAREATDSEIKAAYMRLEWWWRPSKNPDNKEEAERNYKKVTEAYAVLRDPEQRRSYDELTQHQANDRVKKLRSIAKALKGSTEKLFGGRAGCACTHRNTVASDARTPDAKRWFARPSVAKRPQPRECSGLPSASPSLVPSGTEVVVRAPASSREYDGLLGRVCGWSESIGQYSVRLHCGRSLSLRPCNITQLCRVTVHGLKSKPEWNNRSGKVVAYNAEKARYMVQVDDEPSVVALRPKNCVLPRGTAVTILPFDKDSPPLMQMAEVSDVYGLYEFDCFSYLLLHADGIYSRQAADGVLC